MTPCNALPHNATKCHEAPWCLSRNRILDSAFHFLVGALRCLEALRHAMRQGALNCCRETHEIICCVPLSLHWKRYATRCNAAPGKAPRCPAVPWCLSRNRILDSALCVLQRAARNPAMLRPDLLQDAVRCRGGTQEIAFGILHTAQENTV